MYFKTLRGCPRSGVARGAGCERAEAAAPEHHKPVGIDWTNSNIFSDVLLPIFQWHVFPRIWRDLNLREQFFCSRCRGWLKRHKGGPPKQSEHHPNILGRNWDKSFCFVVETYKQSAPGNLFGLQVALKQSAGAWLSHGSPKEKRVDRQGPGAHCGKRERETVWRTTLVQFAQSQT